MKHKLIITGAIIAIIALCDVFSCIDFHNNDWKWDVGPRLGDLVDFQHYSYKAHSIMFQNQRMGYLIFSVGNYALLYIEKGKDETNAHGLSVYIKV